MIKKILVSSLLGLSLVLTGCGSSDGEGESALETQQMLDNGDYTGVIFKLEASASTTSDYLSLAAAYMGKAGFSLSSIISIVATSADSGDDSTFASFIENSKTSSNPQSLSDLSTAVGYYQNVVGNKCLDENTTLSGAESDLCLYVGLSKISQTSVAIGYIAGDVAVLNDSNSSDDKLTASLCAMQYAFDGNTTANSDCSISAESNVIFTQSGKTYGNINIIVDNNQTFEYLITGSANPRSTVLTNGLCTLTDFSTRVDDSNDTAYHACPIDETNTTSETTTEAILVDALNDGTDTIGNAVSDDVKADVDQFKLDVLTANNRQDDTNTTITIEDIIKYLDDNN